MGKIKHSDFEKLYELYTQNDYCKGNITSVSKKFCKDNGIEFTDSVRRRISKILTKGTVKDFTNSLDNAINSKTVDYSMGTLSALKTDGTIMSIEEYCEIYNIPFEDVKSYKLITHNGKGAYYNLVGNPIKGSGYERFYENLLQDLSKISGKPKTVVRQRPVEDESYLLVVDPCDAHIGKLADSFETGEEYDSQIAVQRVKEGVEGILEKTKGFNVDKILFVGGNDILHIDTPKRTTTSNTPQDTDKMWYTNFLIAKELYVDVLNRLLEVADVHFMYNPSNHDWTHGFFLADVIQTYYKDCKNITFDCNLMHRKYFTYGKNLIGTTHGDGAKVQDLPLLMAHEAADWSNVKHRYIYSHHLHHKVSKDYMGVCVESLRSPSSADGWHSRNGYQHSPKAIEGFLHSKEHGQIARIVHLF